MKPRGWERVWVFFLFFFFPPFSIKANKNQIAGGGCRGVLRRAELSGWRGCCAAGAERRHGCVWLN